MTTVDSDRTDPVAEAVEGWEELRPDLDFTAMSIFGRLSRIVAAQRAIFNERHNRVGLSAGVFDILANLRRTDDGRGKTPTQIAESSILSIGSISQKLQKLVEQGLVSRSTDNQDRRLVHFRLTEAGKQKIDSLIECHLRTQEVLLGQLSSEEREMLDRSLRDLQGSLSAMTAAASEVPIEDCS